LRTSIVGLDFIPVACLLLTYQSITNHSLIDTLAMYGNILARCGGSGSVSHRGVSVNTITSRSSSSSSSSTTRRSNNNRSIMAATTSAGVACTMCHSLRITAACSAGTSLQQHVRTNLSNNHNTTARSLNTYNNKGQNHFGNGMNQTVAWNSSSISNGCGILRTSPTLLNNRAINSSSQIKSSSLLLPSNTFGITQHNLTAAPLSTVAGLSSQEALLNGEASVAESSWTMQELVGAILFATAATAGSILLGPIDRLRGKTTGNDGGGGNGGGDNGGGGGSGSGGPIGEHRLDSPLNTKEENKEEGDQEMELGLGVATLPRPYEGMFIKLYTCLLLDYICKISHSLDVSPKFYSSSIRPSIKRR